MISLDEHVRTVGFSDENSFEDEPSSKLDRHDHRNTLIVSGQILMLVLLILPSCFAYINSENHRLLEFAGVLCLGVVVVCLSTYSLASGGADNLFDSLFPFILGAISLIGACYWSMVSIVSGYFSLVEQWRVARQWVAMVAVLLVILVVCTFACQMLRLHRTHVVRSLARSIFNGLNCIAVAGWNFMPTLAAEYAVGLSNGVFSQVGRKLVIMAVAAVAIMAGLCCSSWLWWSDRLGVSTSSPDNSWIAVMLTPIMLSGALVVLVYVGTHRLI